MTASSLIKLGTRGQEIRTGCVLIWSALLAISCGGTAAPPDQGTLLELTPNLSLGESPEPSGRNGEEPPVLYEPSSVALSRDGRVFVLDAGNERVVVFDRTGTLLYTFGRSGTGPGEFRLKGDDFSRISVSGQRLVVFERRRRRVQTFSLEGEFIDGFVLFSSVEDVAASEHGLLTTPVLPNEPAVSEYTASGQSNATWGSVLFSEAPRANNIFNGAYVASGLDVTAVVYQVWPLLRIFDRDAEQKEEFIWLDLPWFGTADWNRLYRRPKELFERAKEDEAWNPLEDERLSLPLFKDIEYVPDMDVFVLLARDGPALQFVERSGKPTVAFLLMEATGPILGMVNDMSISPDGARACIPLFSRSLVYCYAIGGRL